MHEKIIKTLICYTYFTCELVFLFDNMLSMFLPISSKSESSPEVDSSSVDKVSVDAKTLKTQTKTMLQICHFPYKIKSFHKSHSSKNKRNTTIHYMTSEMKPQHSPLCIV